MGNGSCTVSVCCCGCTLKTGSLIIGIIYSIVHICNFIAEVISASNGEGSQWFNAVISLVQAIVSIFLAYGANKELAVMCMGWWISTAVLVGCKCLALLVGAIMAPLLIIPIIVLAIFIAVDIYCIIVVRSYTLELESGGPSPPAA